MSFPNKPHLYKVKGAWYCKVYRTNYHDFSPRPTFMLGPRRPTPQLAYQAWFEYHRGYLPIQLK